MPLKSNNDGTYIANWIPSVSGSYMIQIFIDGCSTGKYNFLTIVYLRLGYTFLPGKIFSHAQINMAACCKLAVNVQNQFLDKVYLI